MAPYILKKKNLIHIIDLRETVRGIITAAKLVEAVAAQGHYVVFVGTKRQARGIVREEAERCGMPCVAERWPGGLLTNYATIRRRLDRLIELEDLEKTGQIRAYSKKMISSLRREQRKITRNLGGVRNMNRLPGLLVIVDPRREHLAVREGVKLSIPVVAWIDTDADPEDIDVVVPANDDAIGAIQIFLRLMADAVRAGREPTESPQAQAHDTEEPAAAEPAPGADSEPEPQEGAEQSDSPPVAEAPPEPTEVVANPASQDSVEQQ